jgi:hypothetical protein
VEVKFFLKTLSGDELIKFGKAVRGSIEPRVSVTPDVEGSA